MWFWAEEIFQKSATQSNALLYYNIFGLELVQNKKISFTLCLWLAVTKLSMLQKKIITNWVSGIGMLWQFVQNKWNGFFPGTNWPQSYQRNYKRGDRPLRAFWIDESVPPETADVRHITQIKSRPSTLRQPDCADVREQPRFTAVLTVSLLVRNDCE